VLRAGFLMGGIMDYSGMKKAQLIKQIEALQQKVAELGRAQAERKRMEEELHLHSEIMANMVEGVILTRVSDSTIVYTNPKFEEMFGYGHGELAGRNISVANAPTEKSPEEIAGDIQRSVKKLVYGAKEFIT